MSESLELTIVYEGPDEDGWIVASVPAVPGAMSQGRTREEARENAIDAMREVLLYRLEREEAAPGVVSEPLTLTIGTA